MSSEEALKHGASAGLKDQELTDGIYEDAKTDVNRGSAATSSLASDKTGGSKGPSMLDAKGPLGGAFTKDGAIGGVGEKVGGPLSSEGMIGKNFTQDGAIGGTVQSVFGNTDKK